MTSLSPSAAASFASPTTSSLDLNKARAGGSSEVVEVTSGTPFGFRDILLVPIAILGMVVRVFGVLMLNFLNLLKSPVVVLFIKAAGLFSASAGVLGDVRGEEPRVGLAGDEGTESSSSTEGEEV